MIVLGIDPGTAITGWAAVEAKEKLCFSAQGYSCIRTSPSTPLPERLLVLYKSLKKIIHQYHPQSMAVEELFFSRYGRSNFAVSQARGVIMLTAAENFIPVVEYNPQTIKISLTGYGQAGKEQIQIMVSQLLGLKEVPRPDDVADALAIAVCHLQSQGYAQMITR